MTTSNESSTSLAFTEGAQAESLSIDTSREPIPGYKLDRKIGTGGYGEVWKATAPGGLVKAIKFVFGDFSSERAVRELRAMERIREVRHPFLLSIERIEVSGNQLVIVSELADDSLRERFNECRKAGLPGIPREELLQYLRDAADALDYMSEKFQLQHLDVKPENMLRVGERVKVADFGLVKDIQDRSVSMLGGMTPFYAAPELFDGRPSAYSDQYSLAIVFQELLVGELPFPGRTIAQLATQHLQSQPRLVGVSPEERRVLMRALAKRAVDRFRNCRSMVDELSRALPLETRDESRSSGSHSGAGPVADGGGSKTAQLSPDQLHAEATPSEQSFGTELLARDDSDQPGATVVLPQSDRPLGYDTVQPSAERPARSREPQPVRELPKLDAPGQDYALRPTLYIGVGGLGGKLLLNIKSRLFERFGDLEKLPAFRFLAIDTDRAELSALCDDNSPGELRTHETLSVPLKPSYDYRHDSQRLLQGISRRWIYNIPRSLSTEGLRPLGRLALIDHADTIYGQVERLLREAASSGSLDATGQQLNRRFDPAPRVVLLGSLTRGTGGGMVMDLCLGLRQLLARLRYSDDGLYSIFVHGSTRQDKQPDLPAVSAYASLCEVFHYSRSGRRFGGDPACNIEAYVAAGSLTRNVYIMDIGRGLDDSGFTASLERIAEFVAHSTATITASVLDRARKPHSNTSDEAVLRTAWLSQVGNLDERTLAPIARRLCRDLIERWAGRLPGANSERTKEDLAEAALASEVKRVVEERVSSTGISLTRFVELANEAIRNALGGSPDNFIRRIVNEILAAQAAGEPKNAPGSSPVDVIQQVKNYFTSPGPIAGASVESLVAERLEAIAKQRALESVAWVFAIVDDPSFRPIGALRAAEELGRRLKDLQRDLGTMAQPTRDATADLERDVRTHCCAGSSSAGRGRGAGPTPASVLSQFVTNRMQNMALAGATRIVQQLQAALADLVQQLTTLVSRLHHIGARLTATFDEGTPRADVPAWDEALAQELKGRSNELVKRMDLIVAERFGAQGKLIAGLLEVTKTNDACLWQLLEMARGQLRAAVRGIDPSLLLLPPNNDEVAGNRLRALAAAANPTALQQGGARRWIFICPSNVDAQRLGQRFQEEVGVAPTVVRDVSACGIVLCCEAEQVPIAALADAVIEGNAGHISLAERLHGRNDIQWEPMPK